MQSNSGDKLNLNNRQIHGVQCYMSPPLDVETWDQLQEQMKVK